MKVTFKAQNSLIESAKAKLRRRHAFAHERVGFISVRAIGAPGELVLLAENFHEVRDEDYLRDPTVGAMMGQEALRRALNIALLEPVGIVHVHMHGHYGTPKFSRTDLHEQLKFVPDFFKVRPQMPHGAIVLSHNSAAGRVWVGPNTILGISEFVTVGRKLTFESLKPPRRWFS